MWCHASSLSGLGGRLIDFISSAIHLCIHVEILLFQISAQWQRRQMATRTWTPISCHCLYHTLHCSFNKFTIGCETDIRDWNRLPLVLFRSLGLIDHRVHKARRSSNDALSRVATHQLNKNMHTPVSWITLWWWGKRRQLFFDLSFLLIVRCLCFPPDAHQRIFEKRNVFSEMNVKRNGEQNSEQRMPAEC